MTWRRGPRSSRRAGASLKRKLHQRTEVKSVTVKRGDTLMRILTNAGAETWQAKAIYEAMAPVFLAKSLQKGQEVRLTLAPAPGIANSWSRSR